ncbi:MAG: hypothetical protein EF810_06630 [Candidatus Methanodesulfokora washburnensis]|uniref:Uncharacterized protein n=1 Tax=Candidatus Methanodesulfokora washburnensis TaxID=2478471 RepID=A0A520KHZ1_9CREN|nr:MAG: hypothetical protein EF810_06630 [Candidatus Methanodesulfokores washburnensis]
MSRPFGRPCICSVMGTVLRVEIADNAVIIRPLRPRRVKIGERIQKIVEEMKREELELEG